LNSEFLSANFFPGYPEYFRQQKSQSIDWLSVLEFRGRFLFAEKIHIVRVRLLRHLGSGIARRGIDILFFVPPQGAPSLLIFIPGRILYQ
jgi:hypothetical protein